MPPATTISASPARISWSACATAARPDRQTLLIGDRRHRHRRSRRGPRPGGPGADRRRPAAPDRDHASTWSAIDPGRGQGRGDGDARRARSPARCARPPSSLPNGVRAPPTITDPVAILDSFVRRRTFSSAAASSERSDSLAPNRVARLDHGAADPRSRIWSPSTTSASPCPTSTRRSPSTPRCSAWSWCTGRRTASRGWPRPCWPPQVAAAGAQLQLLAPLTEQSPDRRGSWTAPDQVCSSWRTGSKTSTTPRVFFGERVCGCSMMQPELAPRGSLINFVHPKDTGGVLIELVQAAAAVERTEAPHS